MFAEELRVLLCQGSPEHAMLFRASTEDNVEAEAEEVHSVNAAFSELAPTLERLQRKAKEDIDVRKSWSLPLAKTHWKMNS